MVIVVYLVSLLIGQAGTVGIGLLVDQYSSKAGLTVFIVLYYAMFWLAWRFALWVADRPSETDDKSPSRLTSWVLAAPATSLAFELAD